MKCRQANESFRSDHGESRDLRKRVRKLGNRRCRCFLADCLRAPASASGPSCDYCNVGTTIAVGERRTPATLHPPPGFCSHKNDLAAIWRDASSDSRFYISNRNHARVQRHVQFAWPKMCCQVQSRKLERRFPVPLFRCSRPWSPRPVLSHRSEAAALCTCGLALEAHVEVDLFFLGSSGVGPELCRALRVCLTKGSRAPHEP